MNRELANVLDCRYWEGRFRLLPGRALAGFPTSLPPFAVVLGTSEHRNWKVKPASGLLQGLETVSFCFPCWCRDNCYVCTGC